MPGSFVMSESLVLEVFEMFETFLPVIVSVRVVVVVVGRRPSATQRGSASTRSKVLMLVHQVGDGVC
jgi:hypothetical protein